MKLNMLYWLYVLFYENKDALLRLPTEIKYMIMIVLGISLLTGMCSKLWKLVSTIILLIMIYFIATFFGFI